MTDATDPAISKSTDSDNPFAVSSLFQGSLSKDLVLAPPPSWFRVEGDTLVCGPQVVLPAMCVHGPSDDDVQFARANVVYPSLKIVLVARQCDVIYFQSRRLRLRWVIRSVICSIAFITGIGLLFVAGGTMDPDAAGIMAIVGLMMIASSIFVLALRHPRLRLARYEPPGIYYVKGFSKEFLTRLAAHPNASAEGWHAQL
jgi:hypothetical protein